MFDAPVLKRDFDRMFYDLLAPMSTLSLQNRFPNTDLYELDNTFVVQMDLPGVKQEDLDISLDGNILTVTAKRQIDRKESNKNYYISEIRRDVMSRSLKLPQLADGAKAEAKLKDGELTIKIPKKEASDKIQISVE